jgi:hypothetical protein
MNFNEIEIKPDFEAKYVKPGVEVVRFTEVSAGAASTGTNFIELTVEDKSKLACATRFYFAPGKNTEISVQALYNFIAVTNNVDKAKAKEMIGEFADFNALALKLSSMLIGKSFAAVIKGEYVTNKDVTKDSWVKGVLSATVTTVDKVDTLKFDASKHVTGTFVKGTGSTETTNTAQADVSKPVTTGW